MVLPRPLTPGHQQRPSVPRSQQLQQINTGNWEERWSCWSWPLAGEKERNGSAARSTKEKPKMVMVTGRSEAERDRGGDDWSRRERWWGLRLILGSAKMMRLAENEEQKEAWVWCWWWLSGRKKISALMRRRIGRRWPCTERKRGEMFCSELAKNISNK